MHTHNGEKILKKAHLQFQQVEQRMFQEIIQVSQKAILPAKSAGQP